MGWRHGIWCVLRGEGVAGEMGRGTVVVRLRLFLRRLRLFLRQVFHRAPIFGMRIMLKLFGV
jgi:hypothetical protein